MKPNVLLPWLLLPFVLTGCAAMSERPQAATETAETLMAQGVSGQANAPISPLWWQQLNDEQLNRLIDTALRQSPDLAMAEARFRQAEAGAQLAGSQRGIQVGVSAMGALAHQKGLGDDSRSPVLEALEERYLGNDGVDIRYRSARLQAKWSLDWWGRYRHQVQAALGQKQAVAYEIAQTRLVIAQGVATYYRQWQLLLAQQDILRARLQLNRERERIVQELITAGQVPPSQLYAVMQGTQQLQTGLSDVGGKIAQTRHALAALSGQPAGALDHFTPNPAGVLPPPPTAQLSADLLGKRPDIAAQREALNARAHLIKSAKAQFYPDISIAALAGWSDLEIGNLPHSPSLLTALMPSVSLPIFTSGALQANLSQKEAEFDEQAARYNKTVYAALKEAADALSNYETAAAAVRSQQQMMVLAQKKSAAAQSLYRAGLDNKLAWVAAQDEVLQMQAQQAQLETQQYLAWLGLNVAFGGGFDSGSKP